MSQLVIIRHNTGNVIYSCLGETILEALNRAATEYVNLSEANLSEANLSGANLSGANLRGANLSEANLSEANLSEANLSEANLSEANLRGANLSEANLSEANLSEANLREANLSEANLSEANLSGANLSGANLWDLGQDVRGYRFFLFFNKENAKFTITAGCRAFNLTQAREHWGARHGRDPLLQAEILARVAMAETIAAVVLAGQAKQKD